MDREIMLLNLCRRKNWTLARLAKEPGVSEKFIRDWLEGRHDETLKRLRAIATALETPIHEIIFGMPDPFETPPGGMLRLFGGNERLERRRHRRKKWKP
jgi:transcriptional regulator with XRE-family HTH domain